MNKPEHHNLRVDGRTFMSPADNKKIKQDLALMDRAVKESKNELQKVRDVATELEQGGFFSKLAARFVHKVCVPAAERLVEASEEMYRDCKNQVKSQYIVSK